MSMRNEGLCFEWHPGHHVNDNDLLSVTSNNDMNNVGGNNDDTIPDPNLALTIDDTPTPESNTSMQWDDNSILEVELATQIDNLSISPYNLVDLTTPYPLDDEHSMLEHTMENGSIVQLMMDDMTHAVPFV